MGKTVILYTLHLESQPNPFTFDAGNYAPEINKVFSGVVDQPLQGPSRLFSGAVAGESLLKGLSKDISPSQLHHQLVLTPKLGEVAPT